MGAASILGTKPAHATRVTLQLSCRPLDWDVGRWLVSSGLWQSDSLPQLAIGRDGAPGASILEYSGHQADSDWWVLKDAI